MSALSARPQGKGVKSKERGADLCDIQGETRFLNPSTGSAWQMPRQTSGQGKASPCRNAGAAFGFRLPGRQEASRGAGDAQKGLGKAARTPFRTRTPSLGSHTPQKPAALNYPCAKQLHAGEIGQPKGREAGKPRLIFIPTFPACLLSNDSSLPVYSGPLASRNPCLTTRRCSMHPKDAILNCTFSLA